MQGAGEHLVELQRGGDLLTGDGAHAGRRLHHVLGRDRPSVREQGGVHPPARPGHRQQRAEHVRAHVHQLVAAVVALAVGGDVQRHADAPRGQRLLDRAERTQRAALVVHGDSGAAFPGARQQRVGLRQVDRHRLLDVQVAGAGGQHAHGQREVQVGLHRHDDDVRLDGFQHLLDVVEAGVDAEVVAKRVQPLAVQVAEPDHVGARVVAICARGVSAAVAAPQQRGAIDLSHGRRYSTQPARRSSGGVKRGSTRGPLGTPGSVRMDMGAGSPSAARPPG